MHREALRSPLSVGSLELPNRIVMPPMVIWASDKSATVKEAHLAHYAARRGPGLVIVEATAVSPEGRLRGSQLGIFDDGQAEGLGRLAALIARNGSVPGIQIHHAGGKATPETTYGLMPLVPSKSAYPADKACAELGAADILRIIDDFVRAARRAARAGFRVIELHGAHGYLATQFLSPATNRRTDEYGGSLENRQRFLLDLYRAVKGAVGADAVVSCRLGVAEEGGLAIEDGIDTARKLAALGMPLVHVSCGNSVPIGLALRQDAYSQTANLGIRVQEALSIPVIAVGGIVDPALAGRLVSSGSASLVAVGKGILADPEWALKVLDGRAGEVRRCIACDPCKWYKDSALCPVLHPRKAAG